MATLRLHVQKPRLTPACLSLFLTLFFVQAGFLHAQPGNAITFDGTNDYVTVPNNAALQITGTALTVEAWINAAAWETNYYEGHIASMEDTDVEGYLLRVGDNGKVNFTIGNGTTWSEVTTPASTLTLDRWHHIAGVYNGSTMAIYVDGRLISSSSVSVTIAAAENNLLIGSTAPYSGAQLFQGSIDEVRIWNVARTYDQLLDYSYQLLTGSETGLVAYYRMSDGSGTSLTDNGPNGLTGTLTNGPTWAASTARIASSAAIATQFRRPGTFLAFDGTNESVSVANSSSLNPTTALTVEAWVYLNSNTGSPRIVSKANASTATAGYGMSVAVTTGRFNPEVVVGGTRYAINSSAAVVSNGAWTHVAFTWAQNGSLIAYINGRRVASTTTANNTLSNTSDALTIAQAAYGASSYLNGNVDEVRIWN
ncbi:MAG: LamG domain-containing protein, partial [Bacteroidetes bacterium]